MMRMKLSQMVDHTNLNIHATKEDIERLCQEALDNDFMSVCVRSHMVSTASGYFARHAGGKKLPHICSVVGFPTNKTKTVDEMEENLSQYTTEGKVKEALWAIREGATEIDMVLDLTSLKKKEYHLVEDDIRSVVDAATYARSMPHLVKVIIETCYLSDIEKALACKIAECAGAHFVKTSTGYGSYGATEADVELMGKVVGENVGIKASGGIQSFEKASQLYEASQRFRPHVFRIGSSALRV